MFSYTILKLYLYHLGRVKFFFALKTPSPAGGTALSLVTQSEDYGQFVVSYKSIITKQDHCLILITQNKILLLALGSQTQQTHYSFLVRQPIT